MTTDLLLDRYRLGDLLGRGGMGWVQRAFDTLSGRDVAIKFLRSDELENVTTLFAWEIQALARLDHNGVVRLFDFGTGPDGQQFMVMALSQGTPLNHIDIKGFTWPRYVSVFDQLLSVIGHSHARGVFHHDLKPGNILIHQTEDGGVDMQIIDFGIAGIQGHRAVSLGVGPTELVGTASYLAPEAVRSYALYRFSPSPDLYAIGVMAYEMAFGIRPFVGKSTREVLYKHATEDPPEREFRPELGAPQRLREFIWSLLAKRPRDRPATAHDARVLLRDIADDTPVCSFEDAAPLPAPKFGRARKAMALQERSLVPLDHAKLLSARPAPFAGRASEMAELRERLTETQRTQRPHVVLVTGPAGLGKSRTVRQLSELTDEQGQSLTAVVPYSLSGLDSVEGWRDGLLSLLGYAGADRDDVEMAVNEDLEWLGLDDELAPDTVLKLLCPPRGEDISSVGQKPVETFDWVGTYVRLITALSQRHPIVLVLDDVGLADDSRGIEVLEFLLRSAAAPILIVLTMRSEQIGAVGIAEAELARLTRYENYSTYRLRGIPAHDLATITGQLMPLSRGLMKRLVNQAGGFPLYAIELLRHWVRIGALYRPSDKVELRDPSAEFPRDIAALWNLRVGFARTIGDSGARMIEILERAAVLGQPFTFHTLKEALVKEGRTDLLRLLNDSWAAWHAEGLWHQIAPDTALFGHESLQEAALLGVDEQLKREIHRYCAQARLATPSFGDKPQVLSVAHHYASAGLPQEAFPFYIRAAREAYRAARYPAAVTHCRLAAQLLASMGASTTDRRWAVIYRVLADSLMALSHFRDAEEIAIRLEKCARTWNDKLHLGTALKLSALARLRQGETAMVGEHLTEAKTMFEHQGVQREMAVCDLELGRFLRDRRPPNEVRLHFQLARVAFSSVGDHLGVAQSLLSEALLLRETGDLDGADLSLAEAHVIFLGHRDRKGMADSLKLRGRVALVREDGPGALVHFSEATSLLKSIGSREGVAECLLLTGRALAIVGKEDKADRYFRRSREEFTALGSRALSMRAHLRLVELAVEGGNYDTTLPHLDALLPKLRRTVGERYELIGLVIKARCLAERSRWTEADEMMARAVEILNHLAVGDLSVARQLELLVQLATSADHRVLAQSAAETALTIYQRLRRSDDVRRMHHLAGQIAGYR